MQELAVPPTSEYYLDLSYSGNKTEDRSQNPSGVLQKLDRPDMLIMVDGATIFVGEDKVTQVACRFTPSHCHRYPAISLHSEVKGLL